MGMLKIAMKPDPAEYTYASESSLIRVRSPRPLQTPSGCEKQLTDDGREHTVCGGASSRAIPAASSLAHWRGLSVNIQNFRVYIQTSICRVFLANRPLNYQKSNWGGT